MGRFDSYPTHKLKDMKYKGTREWLGVEEFESNKPIFEKMVELGYLKKIEPKARTRKKKVIKPKENK